MCSSDLRTGVQTCALPIWEGGSNSIILQPATGYVIIQNNLALTARTVAQLEADDSPAGSISYCSNGDGGSACLAVSMGATDTAGAYQWQRIALGNVIST